MITADDCGLTESINQAALALYDQGMVTTASIMTNFPAAPHAFELFVGRPNLGLGVHLNLSDGPAVLRDDLPSTIAVENGSFRSPLNTWIRSLWPYGEFMDDVEAEFRAQIGVFLETGLQPQHLTTHRHFHIVPALRDLVIDLAREYHIPWVRAYDLRDTSVPSVALALSKRTQRSPAATAHHHVGVPDHLIALRFWLNRDPQELLDELLTLEGIVELVAHPDFADDPAYPDDVAYLPEGRAAEMRYLERFCALLYAQASDRIVVQDFGTHWRPASPAESGVG